MLGNGLRGLALRHSSDVQVLLQTLLGKRPVSCYADGGRTTRWPRAPPPEQRRAGGFVSPFPSRQAGDGGPAAHTPLQPTEQGGGRAPGDRGREPAPPCPSLPSPPGGRHNPPSRGAQCQPNAHTLTTELPSLSTSMTGGSPPSPQPRAARGSGLHASRAGPPPKPKLEGCVLAAAKTPEVTHGWERVRKGRKGRHILTHGGWQGGVRGNGGTKHNRKWSRRRGWKLGRGSEVPAKTWGWWEESGAGRSASPEMHPGLRRLLAGCCRATSRQLGARLVWANQRAKAAAGAEPALGCARLARSHCCLRSSYRFPSLLNNLPAKEKRHGPPRFPPASQFNPFHLGTYQSQACIRAISPVRWRSPILNYVNRRRDHLN